MAKGVDFIIKVGNKVLGGQRGATLNRSAEVIDTTTKNSAGWKENEASYKEWSIVSDGLLIENDEAFQALENAYMNGDKVVVELSTAAGNKYTGDAYITDFPIEAPYDDSATYSVTLQGTGALNKTVA